MLIMIVFLGKVLVHCVQGIRYNVIIPNCKLYNILMLHDIISRSATLVLAYLIIKKRMKLKDAIDTVRYILKRHIL